MIDPSPARPEARRPGTSPLDFRLERLSQKATDFVSGGWGSIALLGLLA